MASENHASYTRIGLTIVIGVAAIVASLIYLGGLRGRGNEVLVETYYDKPVSGLSVGSVVNFRGVKIGEVREISFVGNKYEAEGTDNPRIYILMSLNGYLLDGDGVTEDELRQWAQDDVGRGGVRASVVSSGITGLSRIEIDYVHAENLDPVPPISWTPKYVYIPSKISLFDNFSVAATKVMNQINKMDLGVAWSNINSAVESLAKATDGAKTMLESRQGDIDRLVDDLTETSAAFRDMAAELRRNPSLLIREKNYSRLDETE